MRHQVLTKKTKKKNEKNVEAVKKTRKCSFLICFFFKLNNPIYSVATNQVPKKVEHSWRFSLILQTWKQGSAGAAINRQCPPTKDLYGCDPHKYGHVSG